MLPALYAQLHTVLSQAQPIMKGDAADQLAEAGGKASAVAAAQEELALQENDYEHYVHHRNPVRR